MIKTKLAKKLLTKAEQKHLTKDANVHSMQDLKHTREGQIKMVEEDLKRGVISIEPCWECKFIAKKLNLE